MLRMKIIVLNLNISLETGRRTFIKNLLKIIFYDVSKEYKNSKNFFLHTFFIIVIEVFSLCSLARQVLLFLFLVFICAPMTFAVLQFKIHTDGRQEN